MDKNKLLNWELAGLAFSLLATFVFHQLYDWTGQIFPINLIAPVSESVWEHGKLIFFPFMIFSVVMFFKVKPQDAKNFFAIKLLGAMLGTLAMTVFFYTYSGILGQHNLIMDIISGFIGVAAAVAISYCLQKNDVQIKYPHIVITLGILVAVLFFVFSYVTPNLAWFISS